MKIDEVIIRLQKFIDEFTKHCKTNYCDVDEEFLWFVDALEAIQQQQAEMKSLNKGIELYKKANHDLAEIKNKLIQENEQLQSQQPVKCCECQYFKSTQYNKGECRVISRGVLSITDNNNYCSYGKRKESK